jgi:hypothetical protein
MFAVPLDFMTYKTSPRRKALAGFAHVKSMGCLGMRGNPVVGLGAAIAADVVARMPADATATSGKNCRLRGYRARRPQRRNPSTSATSSHAGGARPSVVLGTLEGFKTSHARIRSERLGPTSSTGC